MPNSLTAADLELFATLRIPSDLVLGARIFRVSDAQARTFGFEFSSCSNLAGLVFPYFDPDKGYRVTARIRRDQPDIDETGREKAKYIIPWGDNGHLYFPPGVKELLGDPSVPTAFVEAEKSALAILAWAKRTGWKLFPIATGGCWGWRGKPGAESEFQDKGRRGPLPDFNRVASVARGVYILFDSNVLTNQMVARAREALAKELFVRGANVYLVNLPQE